MGSIQPLLSNATQSVATLGKRYMSASGALLALHKLLGMLQTVYSYAEAYLDSIISIEYGGDVVLVLLR